MSRVPEVSTFKSDPGLRRDLYSADLDVFDAFKFCWKWRKVILAFAAAGCALAGAINQIVLSRETRKLAEYDTYVSYSLAGATPNSDLLLANLKSFSGTQDFLNALPGSLDKESKAIIEDWMIQLKGPLPPMLLSDGELQLKLGKLDDGAAEKVAPIFFQAFNDYISTQNDRHKNMSAAIKKLKLDRSKLVARAADTAMRAAILFDKYSQLPPALKKDVISHQLMRASVSSNTEDVIWYLSGPVPDNVPEKTALMIEVSDIAKNLAELDAAITPVTNKFNLEFGEITWPLLKSTSPTRKAFSPDINLAPSKNPLRKLPLALAFGGFCGLIIGIICASILDYQRNEMQQRPRPQVNSRST